MAVTSHRPKVRNPQVTRLRTRASADGGGSAYVGKGARTAYEGARHRGTFLGNWPAHLQSADKDWFSARYDVVARSRDVARNEPIGRSAVDRKKNAAIGKGWRFSSKPSARALGITSEAARELGQQINTEWQLFAYGYDFQVDAERRLNFGQLLRVVATHLMVDGEALAQVDYASDDDLATYKTCLRLIDPDRLSNPMGQIDGDLLRNGVELNPRGVPIAYHIRERHPFDVGLSVGQFAWQRHTRYSTPLGRPNILHVFDPDRAGQTRGVPKFAATLKAFRAFSRFTDATLQAATINALILGFVKSSAGPDAVSESFSMDDLCKYDADRQEYYEKNPVEMGDAILANLPFGDEVSLATASKDVTSFEAFTRAIIRLIAASLGVTYEELSMDYSQTNYSSARAAMVHAWNDTVAFMSTIESHLAKPFFVAWLEEAFDNGRLKIPAGAPDFYDAINAYAEGRFLGPPKGFIDATKEIVAAAGRIEAQISTLEDECAEQGRDYEEVLDQLAFEHKMRVERGLPDNVSTNYVQATAQPDNTNADPRANDPQNAAHGSALARMATMANSAEHEAALDARPILS